MAKDQKKTNVDKTEADDDSDTPAAEKKRIMEAALQAAQAAMAEAEASATYQQGRHPHDESMADLQDSDPNNMDMDMDASQMALYEAMQSANMGDGHLMEDIDMMGLDPSESMQLMQMLRQQQEEASRPDEHYLTIAAQNGTFFP